MLFHFANAAMLPLALNALSKHGEQSGLVISAAIIVPQIVVAAGCSPWAGQWRSGSAAGRSCWSASRHCRCAALLFIACRTRCPLVVIQVLDGVSATVFGLTCR